MKMLPTLDDLAEHPELAATLSESAIEALLVKQAAISTALLTRLLAARRGVADAKPNGDRFLGVVEVAAKIGKSRSWVEKHTDELPSRRRVGGEALWSERDVEMWMRTRPSWASR